MSELLLKRKTNHLRIAQEIIDFQNNSFGIQIEAIVSKVRDDLALNRPIDDLITELESLIFKRLGLKVRVITDWDPLAMVSMNFNKHKILLPGYLHGKLSDPEQNAIIRDSKQKKGQVDLANAKVSGVFSEYNNQLYVNFSEIIHVWKITNAEITAGILHELGHAFYACEFEDRLESTNQVLSNLATEISGTKKEKNLTYILTELKSLDDKVTPEDVEVIVNGNRAIAGYRLFKLVIGTVTSNIPDPTYDRTSNEQLADNFATRFGYGRQIVTMLEKVETLYNGNKRYKETNLMDTILSSLGTIFKTCVIIGILLILPTLIPAFMLMVYSLLRVSRVVYSTDPYDDLKDRYKRIRNEYVAHLKDTKLNNEELKHIVSNVKFIDELINKLKDDKVFFNVLANAIYKKDKQASQSTIEQRLLEDLAFNDLFLKAAELKTI